MDTQLLLRSLTKESFGDAIDQYKTLVSDLQSSADDLAIRMGTALGTKAAQAEAVYESYLADYGSNDPRTKEAKAVSEAVRSEYEKYDLRSSRR